MTARTSGEAAEVLLGEPATLGALVSGFGRHLFSGGEWRVLVPFQASHFDGNQKVPERTPLSAGTWSLSGKSLPEVILSKGYGLLGSGVAASLSVSFWWISWPGEALRSSRSYLAANICL